MKVLRAGVVLERFMMRNIVADSFDRIITRQTGVVRTANRAVQRIVARRSKPALEPSPRYVLRVQQIADVRSCHRNGVRTLQLGIGQDAFIACGTRVADYRTRGRAVGDIAGRARGRAVGLCGEEGRSRSRTRDQVERSH